MLIWLNINKLKYFPIMGFLGVFIYIFLYGYHRNILNNRQCT